MARVNYAEAAMRFSHIDAEFVSCHFDLPNGNNYFTLEFYPWWEHPLFIEAKQTGAFWRFNNSDDGIRPVTVYPIGLRQFHISAHIQEIIDWKFVQEHPFLWQYEQTGRIYCDTPLSVETVLQITAEAVSKLDRALDKEDHSV